MWLLQNLSDLPLEMLEAVLMRAYWMLYANDFDGDDDNSPCRSAMFVIPISY